MGHESKNMKTRTVLTAALAKEATKLQINPNKHMKTKHLKFAALALLPLTLLTLSSCSSTPSKQSTVVIKSDTSTTIVDTFKATATVTAIDAATRTVKLTLANGKHATVKCGPGVVNFKQIRINDIVKVTMTEELAVYLDKGQRLGDSRTSSGELAAIGDKPGGVLTDTMRETVKITAIDTKTRKVTFKYKDGTSKTAKAGEHINLAKVKVGDSVTISQTQAVAISVEKP